MLRPSRYQMYDSDLLSWYGLSGPVRMQNGITRRSFYPCGSFLGNPPQISIISIANQRRKRWYCAIAQYPNASSPWQ
jgi:hypothetical protein